MKNLLLTLLILSTTSFSQTSKNEVNRQSATSTVNDKQSQKRMQFANKSNNKYMEKYRYQNNNQTIICESNRGRRSHCNIDTRYGVNLVRQISNSSCNYHWGYDQNGIWVDGGCRAEFSVNFGWDQPGAEGNVMVCESHNYQRNYCPAYLGGRDVYLLRQSSNSSCVNNWGYDRNGIWVTNGCRAEFVVEDRSYGFNDDIVVCSSRNLRFQGCQADTRGGVEFLRQISRTSCNGNWGYDRQGIWVNNGCRAKFRVLPYRQNNYGNNGRQSDIVSCSSRNKKRKYCPADTRGGVTFKKQKSRASCEGNWGYDRGGIWVTNGCRATFKLRTNQNMNNGYGNNRGNNNGYRNNQGNNSGYGNNQSNNDGYRNNNNQQISKITCSSRNLKRTTCSIPNGGRVKLEKQLSKSTCRGSWGYNRREIWVKSGCRAVFSVQ